MSIRTLKSEQASHQYRGITDDIYDHSSSVMARHDKQQRQVRLSMSVFKYAAYERPHCCDRLSIFAPSDDRGTHVTVARPCRPSLPPIQMDAGLLDPLLMPEGRRITTHQPQLLVGHHRDTFTTLTNWFLVHYVLTEMQRPSSSWVLCLTRQRLADQHSPRRSWRHTVPSVYTVLHFRTLRSLPRCYG